MDYRRQLSDFASRIHLIFGLHAQGRKLLAFVVKAIGCKYACMLFLNIDDEDFTVLSRHPDSEDNPLSALRWSRQDPLVDHLRKEHGILRRESFITPEETRKIELDDVELLVPLISRKRLMGIMVLGSKQEGNYLPEDLILLKNIARQVAVSMEKEHLREQYSAREKELSVLSRAMAILVSDLNIQKVFTSFVKELGKIVDISWAAIALIENDELDFLTVSSDIDSVWKAGQRVPIKGTTVEKMITHNKALVESNSSPQSQLATGKPYLQQGVCSMAYLPLLVRNKAIGSLVLSSHQVNAYSQRHIMLLEELARQMALPVKNSRLHAEVSEKSRIDDLTGLLNRRSLDEIMTNEISRHSRYGGVFSVIILDLDSFKAVNDNYGHLAGDDILMKIGNIVRDSIRGADQAFRYGGDEFAVLLPNTGTGAADKVAERIRKRLATKVRCHGIPITSSLGLATWPTNGVTASELIAAADAALYLAKQAGGNRTNLAERLGV